MRLQFLLLPIRDWNIMFHLRLNCVNKLQFLLLPIRDWNFILFSWSLNSWLHCNFYYSLLGIETKNFISGKQRNLKLQFLLLPIRDWNIKGSIASDPKTNCNFYYSLLGIETPSIWYCVYFWLIAISTTPY